MTNKKTSLIFLGMMILGILLLVNFASAEFWACFNKGDKINYCNSTITGKPYRPPEIVNSVYPYCMSVYKPDENCYVHGVWGKCNNLDPSQCTHYGNNQSNNSGGGGTTFDLSPPVLTIITPLNDSVWNTKKIFLNFSLDEVATVYYKDANKSTSSWINVCDKCSAGNPSYAKLRSFAEGKNDLLFKATDTASPPNEAYLRLHFLVDSTKPIIYTTSPKINTFADGTFSAQFKELNPKRLTLHYGNDSADADLSKCYTAMAKQNCDIDVNLDKYNGLTIPYYFEIEDIAGNTYSSRPVSVKVDTKDPVLNNPSSFFKVSGRYVEFNLSIDEPNLLKVTYLNTLSLRSAPVTMCTKLTHGYCYKKQGFSKGNYSLSVQITDKAGHSIAVPATFTIL